MTGPLVIGDLHGCSDELAALLDRAGPATGADVVLVGDLFTRGPDPVGVWRQVRDGGLRSVLGNHDDRLLRFLDGARQSDTHARDVVAALDAEDRTWRRWLRERPLFLPLGDWLVVHACLHVSGSRAATTREMATKFRRWPDNRDGQPFWWSVYHGPQRVVFGHDAARGHVRIERNGEPWVVGIDTGCVYGQQLTGWYPEEDRLVQVPARRAYAKLHKP
ncbi:MAG: metallophosphoesterase [Myxococcota bacterium]